MASAIAKTPSIRRILKADVSCQLPQTPNALQIPASPCLKNLGFGTGVKVMLYERSPKMGAPRSPWAIKKLSQTHSKSDVASRLEQEAAILKRLSHPNIIGYRGYERQPDGTMILALENGERSLFDLIEEYREAACESTDEELDGSFSLGGDSLRDEDEYHALEASKILRVVHSVASALHYLHTDKRLLHGDLKSGNILIQGDFESIKLCDFGVTLDVNKDGVVDNPNAQYIGTDPWSAPEVIREDLITTKADIYALGCVIFEMLSLDTPHSDKLHFDEDVENGDESFDDTAYQQALGSRPNLPSHLHNLDESYEPVLGLFYACTMEDPVKRPSAKMILNSLKHLDRE